MALYYEAAEILSAADQNGGSIKSIVFGRKTWKSDQKTLFALATEAAKWSEVLSETIERSNLLQTEKQLNPRLSLLLSHDLLLSKRGISLPSSHGLHQTMSRNKARLSAELSKARLRRGFSTMDALRAHVNTTTNSHVDGNLHQAQPRWIRINSLRTSLDEQLKSTFSSYKRTETFRDIITSKSQEKVIYLDEHIPNVVAVLSETDITTSSAYKEGKIILQDKASCFPAYLLDPSSIEGDVLDACAAPGNKTTHVTAIMREHSSVSRSPTRRMVVACERDVMRSETLSKMVKLAGANDLVRIKAKQDFLKLDPGSTEFSNVTAIILDPSCSGSGIIGRDEAAVKIHLPASASPITSEPSSRKRKRHEDHGNNVTQAKKVPNGVSEAEQESPEIIDNGSKLQDRLKALSVFQARLLEHAMSFSAAVRITYSTCSVHSEENEQVIVRALHSDIATKRRWRIMRREEQVEGLRKWHVRGDAKATLEALQGTRTERGREDTDELADACIRCNKAGHEGTMGFFVAGFVREADPTTQANDTIDVHQDDEATKKNGNSEDEWNGFSDDE